MGVRRRPGMLGLADRARPSWSSDGRAAALLDWAGVAERMSRRTGARSAGLAEHGHGPVAVGAPANLTLVDPGASWTGRARRAGQQEPQHAVRRDGTAGPGGRHVPAGRTDRARREAGRLMNERMSERQRVMVQAGKPHEKQALLVLEDGRTFRGEAYGAVGEAFGEAVFSHRHDRLPGDADRPVLPPAGRRADRAADRQYRRERRGRRVRPDLGRRVRGARPGPPPVQLAVDAARSRTSWPARASWGSAASTPAALTRHLRERGAMRVGVLERSSGDPSALLARCWTAPPMAGADLSARGLHAAAVRRGSAVGEHAVHGGRAGPGHQAQ